MKRCFILVICFCLLSANVSAFELTDASPDNSFVESLGRDVGADREYLKRLATSYSDRFVVTELQTADISCIDSFYSNLSEPLTISEIDAGRTEIFLDMVWNEKYKKHLNTFKVFGGFCGYTAEFEPIAYYKVYRDIMLVGGYVKYTKNYQNPDDAYWQYICSLEDLTKEVVPYETRIRMLEKVRSLSLFMDNDKSFKIFILKDGQIDSMWEGADSVG